DARRRAPDKRPGAAGCVGATATRAAPDFRGRKKDGAPRAPGEGSRGPLRRRRAASARCSLLLDRSGTRLRPAAPARVPVHEERSGEEEPARGARKTNRLEETGVPGLYVAGDASRDVQLAIVAAAEGAKAAFAINRRLQESEGLSVAPAKRAGKIRKR